MIVNINSVCQNSFNLPIHFCDVHKFKITAVFCNTSGFVEQEYTRK